MRKKICSYLLALSLVLGITCPAAAAEAPGEDLFQMQAIPSLQIVPGGEPFTVSIRGSLQDPSSGHALEAFSFTLDYPKEQVQLIDLAPAGIFGKRGYYEANLETASLSYNAVDLKGIDLKKSPELAKATFRVLPAAAEGAITIGLKNAEIVRPQDQFSTLGTIVDAEVRIQHTPVLTLSEIASPRDTEVAVQFHHNPAGRLLVAVYNQANQMLRYQYIDNIAEGSPEQVAALELTGGACVRAFLLDSSDRPLCLAAEQVIPPLPVLELPGTASAGDGSVTVHFNHNPAGTLTAAVYDSHGRMLALHTEPSISADADALQIALPLSGGACVRVFLLDSKTGCPLCPAAETQLT